MCSLLCAVRAAAGECGTRTHTWGEPRGKKKKIERKESESRDVMRCDAMGGTRARSVVSRGNRRATQHSALLVPDGVSYYCTGGGVGGVLGFRVKDLQLSPRREAPDTVLLVSTVNCFVLITVS